MTPASSSEARRHAGRTLGVLALPALAFALLQTMVSPALPAIQSDLGVSTTGVTWVMTAYLLAASVATPIAGRLGDMFGKDRVLLVVLGFFAAGSLIAALTHSLGWLIAGRVVQGMAGATFPLAFGIIRDELPREQVATGIGLISATFGVGGGLGLTLAGPLVDGFGYEAIFWVGLAMVLVAMAAAWRYVPASPVRSPARIDWAGAALLAGGLVGVLLGISQASRLGVADPATLGLLCAGAVLLAIWARVERRVPQPLVDMQMMRRRAVLSVNLVAFLVGLGMFGSFILVPQFVQAPQASGYGFGASVTVAGLFLAPSAAIMLVAGPLAGVLGTRYGSRVPLLLGTAVGTGAFTLLAVAHDTAWQIVLATSLQGLGIGLAFASMANLVVEAVDQRQTGVATGMNTIMRTIGGSVGAQAAAAILAASTIAGTAVPTEGAFTVAFGVSALAALGAFGLALAVPGRSAPAVGPALGSREGQALADPA